MKTLSKIGIFFLIISGILAYAAPALAATPYLSITSLNNNLEQISISYANPYSQISLYEQQNSSVWTVINNLGTTDGTGSYNQQTTLGNGSGTLTAYVVVGGLQSNTVTVSPGGPCVYSGYNYGYGNTCGCTYNCGSGLSLSQTSVSMTVGQTASVSVQNSSGSLYISNNSNQSIVTATASYNSISLYGLAAGSATITICASSYSQCATLFVTVTGNGTGNGSVTFSQSNVNLALNQNITIYVYGTNGYNSFYLSNNSNNNSVIASLSGNILTLTGYNAGSSTLTVCQSSGGGCGSLYVTVGGGTGGGIIFSQNNLVLTAGQTSTVYINGYSGYYVSSNSNGSVASAAVNGSVLTVTAMASGNTIFTVCQNNNNTCGSLSVAVSGNNCGYGYNCGSGTVSFSQNNVSLTSGQSQTVTVYGNAPFNISSNSNSGAVSASVSGNIITLYGYSSGSSSISVCSNTYGGSAYGGCGTLYVTVNGYNNCSYPYNNNCGNSGSISLSQTSVSVNVGQTSSISVYGNGPFILSSNGSSNIASGVMSGNTLNIYGSQPGSSTITVCQQNYSSSCASVYVTVTGNGCTYNCGSVLGSSIYANGQLLNIGGTVYIVYQNTLTAFGNASAFLGLGFSFSNVINAGYQNGLTISSYVISTTAGAHPWGSWIKNGAAVYFVSQLGLIPVPDWNTFLNNGGSAGLIVPANAWDFQLPTLAPMAYGDGRLR